MRANELLAALHQGKYDERLRTVYGGQPLAVIYGRLTSLIEGFCAAFDPERTRSLAVFSAPGRTELGGNHTDHQGGCALAASADVDTLGCVVENADGVIRVLSRGHRMAEIGLSELRAKESERSRSSSLVRGIAAQVSARGFSVGGFDAYTETNVLRGRGLSSSAAFEVLLGTVCNELFCGGALTDGEIARIGQYAENVYYGKPCGLLDQLSCASGGVIAVDFADPAQPSVRRCEADFGRFGYALVIVDSGAGHAALDEVYAAIPREMGAVADYFGKTRLIEVPETAFWENRAAVSVRCGERAALRAEHFFTETKRAREQYEALAQGNLARYLTLMRESGRSSEEKLQNVRAPGADGERLLRVIERARTLAGAEGAARVHGGGFAGTAQALVPLARLAEFITGMEALCGAGSCHAVQIRSVGGVKLLE